MVPFANKIVVINHKAVCTARTQPRTPAMYVFVYTDTQPRTPAMYVFVYTDTQPCTPAMYVFVYTDTQPRTRPVVYMARTRPCTCVYVYTGRKWPCTRPYTAGTRPYNGRLHVHIRVRGPYTLCTLPCNSHVHFYTCARVVYTAAYGLRLLFRVSARVLVSISIMTLSCSTGCES